MERGLEMRLTEESKGSFLNHSNFTLSKLNKE